VDIANGHTLTVAAILYKSRIVLYKKKINYLFKCLIVLLAGAILYAALNRGNHAIGMVSIWERQWQAVHFGWLLGACLLVPVNWWAEVMKWYPFMNRYEPMSWQNGLRAILAGAGFALFTPNRIGDFGGRLLFVSPSNQWRAVMLTAVGSISQYLALLTGGIWGGVWLAGLLWDWNLAHRAALLTLSVPALVALHWLYFNIRIAAPLARRIPWLRRVNSYTESVRMLEHFKRRDLFIIWGWSVVRYAVYSVQYWLLLRFFGIHTGLADGLAGIATIYLLQTVVPLPVVAGILVRGSLAVFVWTHFDADEPSCLAASFILWIINVILPALLGTFSLISVKLTKPLGYDDD
jgi:hypothetical protein